MPVSALVPKPRTVKKAPKPAKATPFMLSGALKRFVLDNPHASADTQKATQRAVDLFLQAFGDAPVSIIGGEKAGASVTSYSPFLRHWASAKAALPLKKKHRGSEKKVCQL